MDSKPRLSPADWITAGFTALLAEGPSALRAESLARQVGATKGSFYWHFADVPTFHKAMLDAWETAMLAAIPQELAQAHTTPARLRTFGQSAPLIATPTLATTPLGPAIRAWAQGDEAAAATVARIDAACLDALRDLLHSMGITNPEIGRLILGAGVGLAEMHVRDGQSPEPAMGSLVDLVLALR